MAFSVDERYIAEAEDRLGVRLPEAYRAKLMRENGGALSTPPDHWDLYPVRDSSDRKRLKRTCNDIVLETTKARAWEGFPPRAVAIGTNSGGDQLVFLPESSGSETLRPMLCWWDHETSAVHRIADDIASLL